jgi:hypothetical protein
VPDFSRVIILGYQRILGRPPDPSGLDHYNGLMNGGLTEADMREALLRSPEYSSKNPDRLGVSSTSARSTKKKTTKRKRKTGRKKSSG